MLTVTSSRSKLLYSYIGSITFFLSRFCSGWWWVHCCRSFRRRPRRTSRWYCWWWRWRLRGVTSALGPPWLVVRTSAVGGSLAPASGGVSAVRASWSCPPWLVIDRYGNFHLTDTDTDTDMLIITYTDTDTDTDMKKTNSPIQIPIPIRRKRNSPIPMPIPIWKITRYRYRHYHFWTKLP